LAKAGPTCLVIRLTSDPAYSTLTGPDPVAAADAAAEEGALLGAAADEEEAAGADELDELEEELQPAAASPRKANPTTASRARGDRDVGMCPR
jgi:hypothetical protein